MYERSSSLDNLSQKPDFITREEEAWLENSCVPAAAAFELEQFLNLLKIVRIVDVECPARLAESGQFNFTLRSEAKTLPGLELAIVEVPGREVFTESPWEEAVSQCVQFIEHFVADQEDGLVRASMDCRVSPGIAFEALRGEFGLRGGTFGDTPARDIELAYFSGHHYYHYQNQSPR